MDTRKILSSQNPLADRLKQWSELQARDLYFVNKRAALEDALPPIDGSRRMPNEQDLEDEPYDEDEQPRVIEHPGEIESDPTRPHMEGVQALPFAVDPALPDKWLSMPESLGMPIRLDYMAAPLGNMLDETARRFADKTAIIYQDTQWRYRDFLSLVNRVAGGLARHGLRPGDRVMCTLPNCPEFMALFFALQKLGAVLVNTGPLASPEDMDQTIELTKPVVLVGLDLQAAQYDKVTRISELKEIIWVTLKSYQPLFTRFGYMIKKWQTGGIEADVSQKSWQTLVTEAPSRPPTMTPDMEAVALLQPTGGTTGTLKLAQLSHRNLLANALQLNILMKSPPGQDRYLAVLPMFHVFGLSTCLITPILNGACVMPLTRFVPGQVFDVLERYRPTIFPLVPAIANALCHAAGSDRKKYAEDKMAALFKSVRVCVSGAAPLTDETAARFESMSGVTLLQGFGMTESSPVTACNVPESFRHASIGHPLPDTVIRVADMDDPAITLKDGEVGEMLVAGPQIMRGYYRNQEQTAKVLWQDEEGVTWLRTGDLATVDPVDEIEDGLPRLRIVGRKKHMIIRNGFNIYPEKLEKVLLSHDGVQDAAVVGKPDKDLGEQVVAVIVFKNHTRHQKQELDEKLEAIRLFARSNLGKYESPGEFIISEELPRNGLGKFQAHKLKASLNFDEGEPASDGEDDTIIENDKAVGLQETSST